MPDVLELAKEMQADFDKQRIEVENLKKGLDLRAAKVKKAEKEIEEKNKQLAEWEIALNKKYEEVSRIENAKFLEMKAEQEVAKAEQERIEIRKIAEDTEKKLAEIKLREEEVVVREQEVTQREKDYREKIKRQVADKMAEQYLGLK